MTPPRAEQPFTAAERARIAASPMLTVAEAARILRVSQTTVHELCNSGRLRHLRIRASPSATRAVVRIPVAELDAYKQRVLLPLKNEVS